MIVLKIAVVIGCFAAAFKSMDNIVESSTDKEIAFNTFIMTLSVFAVIYILNN